MLEQTWRWYGPKDPVSLADIRMAGATGIVTALHEVPIGEIWSVEALKQRKAIIEAAGLTWSVVESIPVHEEIKFGGAQRDQYIEAYKQSIINMGIVGIDTLCYNFMPVLDWTRTDLSFKWNDGSEALAFDMIHFIAFDLFMLKREGAEVHYTQGQIAEAKAYFDNASPSELEQLKNNIIAGMPGRMVEAYDLEQFRGAISRYQGMDASKARENLAYFLTAVVPVAEKANVRMAIHPDDPPITLLGLPRVVRTEADVAFLLSVVNSPANGITMCVGTFGSHPDNDVEGMVERFKDRIHFVHLRNVAPLPSGGFVESDHLDGRVDMYRVLKTLLLEKHRREQEGLPSSRLPFRPDHGHKMLDDLGKKTNPGYSAIGRLRGLAELRGLQIGIERSMIAEA